MIPISYFLDLAVIRFIGRPPMSGWHNWEIGIMSPYSWGDYGPAAFLYNKYQ
jgi:hypothetical protein